MSSPSFFTGVMVTAFRPVPAAACAAPTLPEKRDRANRLEKRRPACYTVRPSNAARRRRRSGRPIPAPSRWRASTSSTSARSGVTLPFLPAYLKSLGLSGAEVGALLALGPVFACSLRRCAGTWRTGPAGRTRVLSFISARRGAGLRAAAVRQDASGPWPRRWRATPSSPPSITSLVDSLALHRVAAVGGSYSRIRLFGSLGFVLATLALRPRWSTPIDRTSGADAAGADGGLLRLQLAASAPGAARHALQHPLAGLRLLRHTGPALLLAATCLHWIACAPYHGSFGIHVTALGLPPSVVGLSAAAGRDRGDRGDVPLPAVRGPHRPPAPAVRVVRVQRWCAGWGWPVTSNPHAIVALSLLHGFTFGAFYVARVGFVAQRVPPELRASGQALFVAVTFGVGGLVGYLGAGAGVRRARRPPALPGRRGAGGGRRAGDSRGGHDAARARKCAGIKDRSPLSIQNPPHAPSPAQPPPPLRRSPRPLAQADVLFGTGQPAVFKEEELDRRFLKSKVNRALINGTQDPNCAAAAAGC